MNVPAYGFSWNDNKDSYLVDPEAMPVVSRIFEAVADGESIYSLIQRFNANGVKPSLSNHRNRAFIRNLIQNDLYRPHTYVDLQRLVMDGNLAPEVLASLDADQMYGICWAGRRQIVTAWKGREKVKKTVLRPRRDWIAVPVPSSGIPRSAVDRARERLNDNWPCPRPTTGGFGNCQAAYCAVLSAVGQ